MKTQHPAPNTQQIEKLSIEGMEFYAHHGYYDVEQEMGNKFLVDLHIETDLSVAAQTDDLSQALNYEQAYQVIKEQMAIRSRLLEHAAKRIIDALKEKIPEIQSLELKLSKLNPSLKGPVGSVSVTMRF